jgi:hypothetical protein
MAEDRQFHQKRSTTPRRDGFYPPDVLPGTPVRSKKRSMPKTEIQTEDDYLLGEDDPSASRPFRPGSSAIRLNNPPAGQRAISTQVHQNVPVPYRRATQSPVTSTGDAVAARSRNATIRQSPLYAPPAPPKEHRRVHLLLPIGIGMLAMLALWVFGSLVLAWGLARYDDVRYGNPRTFQINATVGHGHDSTLHPSHFIAINLNRHIVVYEIMAGDPTKTITYGGPYLYGSGEDLTPPILEFRDVTTDGKLDMIIHLGDQSVVFINTGDKFRPSNANDNIHL